MSDYKLFLPSTEIKDYGYPTSNPLHTGDYAHAPYLDSDSEDDINRSRRTNDNDDYLQSSEGEEADEEEDYDDNYDDLDSNNGSQLRDEINRKARALFDFVPENDNEVSLTEGQIIWISYRHGQGWLVAEDPETGENGLVPEEYVEIFHEQIGVGEQDDEEGDIAKPFLPEILREEGGSYDSDSSEWVDTDDGEDQERQFPKQLKQPEQLEQSEQSEQPKQPKQPKQDELVAEITEKTSGVTI